MNEVNSLTINRAKWFKGAGHHKGQLLTSKGKMCCLGFSCLAFGVPKEQLRYIPMPYQLPEDADIPSWLREKSHKLLSSTLEKIMENSSHKISVTEIGAINDMEELPDSHREDLVTRFFNQHGIAVTFVGEPGVEIDTMKGICKRCDAGEHTHRFTLENGKHSRFAHPVDEKAEDVNFSSDYSVLFDEPVTTHWYALCGKSDKNSEEYRKEHESET